MLRLENEQGRAERRFGPGRRLCAFLLTFVLLLGLLPATAFAVSVSETVNSEADFLAAMEQNPSSEITLNFGGDLVFDKPITVPSGTTLNVNLEDCSLTADAALSEALFTVSPDAQLIVWGSGNGSVLNAPAGAFTVENRGSLTICAGVLIQGCKAENGAAVYVKSGGTAELGTKGPSGLFDLNSDRSLRILDCEAVNAGGAVYVEEGGLLKGGDRSVSIEACSAREGGGLSVENGGTVQAGSGAFEISGCSADLGGGVYVGGGDVSLKTLRNNSAAQGGGAYLESGFLSCTAVNDNTAIQGGGVFCNGELQISDGAGTMNGNSAEQGGAVFVTGTGSVVLTELSSNVSTRTADNNTANGNGGVFYISLGGKVSLSNVSMSNNKAAFFGAAVYADSPTSQQGEALLKLYRAVLTSGNTVSGRSEDVYLSEATYGQIGARDLSDDARIYVTLPKSGTERGVIRDTASLSAFIIGGQTGGSGAGFAGETGGEEQKGHVSYNGEVGDFATLKATLAAGKSVKLLQDITLTQPLTIPVVSSGITIDLNGKTLSADSGLSGRMITVPDKAKLKIDSSRGSGSIKNAPYGAVEILGGGELEIAGTVTFDKCRALNGGGVLVSSGAKLTLSGWTAFENCKATEKGGAIFVDGAGKSGGTLSIKYSTAFDGCEAGYGGGLYLEMGSKLAWDARVDFTGCTATQYGGAVYTAQSVSAGECYLNQNSAGKGGAIFIAPGAGFSDSASFSCMNGTADSDGGGIYVSDGASFSATSAEIAGCTAENGGGIYAESDATVETGTMTGSASGMSRNKANQRGGFLYLAAGASAVIGNASIFDNTAGLHGGAIYTEADSAAKAAKLTFKDTLMKLSGNKAGSETEDIYLGGASAEQITIGEGGIADGVKIHASVKRTAEDSFLKDRNKYISSFELRLADEYYLLRADTGINSGENVLYFGIRYLDVEGVERTQFIYPQESSLYEGYELAGGLTQVNARAKLVKELTGYSLAGQAGDSVLTKNSRGLQPGTSDYYVFTPRHALDQLIRIDVFMRYDKRYIATNKGWHCTGLNFYHVDEFYGVEMAGYYSNQLFLSFRGQLLGHLVPQNGASEVSLDISISQSDEVIRIGNDRTDNYELEIPETPIQYDSKNCEYMFNVEFADKYGAGIEALASAYGAGQKLDGIVEALTLKVQYTDVDNRVRIVYMPFVVNSLTWAVDRGYLDRSMPVIGAAQQGESLLFVGALPEIKRLDRCWLIFGKTAASEAGIELGNWSERQKNRQTELNGELDCSLLGMRVYAADTKVKVSPYSTAFDLTPDETADPLFCYTAVDTLGEALDQGSNEVYLTPFDGRTPLRPTEKSGGYLVRIVTDTMDLAATTNEIIVNIKYISQSGDPRSTGDIILSSQSRDIFGYWPGAEGNVAYKASMKAGRAIEFLLDAPDVSYFTGVTLTIQPDENGAVDDWQMREFSIYKHISSGKRIAEWDSSLGFSDRAFYRVFTLSDAPVVKYPNNLDIAGEKEDTSLSDQDLGKVYLSKETPSVTITFEQNSRSGKETTSTDPNWETLRYSMTYEEAHSDLKFAETMCSYSVKVTVAGNKAVETENGDAGSNNLFYFMLAFENGTSGYVLANQQLDSDGFRADRTETFTIKTNRDYGTLSAIYIIPDDNNDDTKYDKLNVKEIKVVKNSTGGIAKTWTVSSVGWIGISYLDTGSESTLSGRPGRTETDMAKIFYVDKQGYSINLMFAVKTGSYNGKPKLEGSLMATYTYMDNNNTRHTNSVDVAELMYEYANKTAEYYKVDEKNDKAKLSEKMARDNKTDRFIISFDDLQYIMSFSFEIYAEKTTEWNVESLDVYTIESDGLVQINTKDEYQRSNKVSLLCSNRSTDNSQIVPGPDGKTASETGAMERLTIQLTDHKIKVDMLSSDWKSTITREPTSDDDRLNIYVFMRDPIPSTQPQYSMSTKVTCNHPSQHDYVIQNQNMVKSADSKIFYALNVKASGISGVASLEIKSNDISDSNLIGIDRVVIQHVRSGVTLRTYSFDLYGDTARFSWVKLDAPTSASSGGSSGDQQKVRLMFSEDTPTQTLVSEKEDIMLAIRYKSTSDVERGNGETSVTYNSRYVYLTDVTEETLDEAGLTSETQKYKNIGPGKIVEIDFNEAYVADIVGISIASVGSIDATVESACVLCTGENWDSGSPGWYSFTNGTRLSTAPYVLTESGRETVMPVRMTFTTLNGLVDSSVPTDPDADFGDSEETKTKVSHEIPIIMKVWYQNSLKNTLECRTIRNLNDYVTDGGFKTGETATVEFFMENTASIRYIELEPHSTFGIGATWELGTVTCTAEVDGIETEYRPKTVNKNILQDHPEKIYLATVTVVVTTMVRAELTGEYLTQATNSKEETGLELQIKAGNVVTMVPDVLGTLNGYGFTVSAVEGTSMNTDAIVDCYYITSDGKQIVFTPPETKGEVSYTVRIASEEMPEDHCDITVKVIGEPEAPKEDPEPAKPAEEEEKPGSVKDDDDDEEEKDDPPEGEGDSTPTEESASAPSEAPPEDEPET